MLRRLMLLLPLTQSIRNNGWNELSADCYLQLQFGDDEPFSMHQEQPPLPPPPPPPPNPQLPPPLTSRNHHLHHHATRTHCPNSRVCVASCRCQRQRCGCEVCRGGACLAYGLYHCLLVCLLHSTSTTSATSTPTPPPLLPPLPIFV